MNEFEHIFKKILAFWRPKDAKISDLGLLPLPASGMAAAGDIRIKGPRHKRPKTELACKK